MKDLTRITFDPDMMGGKPCIRGMRVTVGMIIGLLATGHSKEEVLKLYPYSEPEDVEEALRMIPAAHSSIKVLSQANLPSLHSEMCSSLSRSEGIPMDQHRAYGRPPSGSAYQQNNPQENVFPLYKYPFHPASITGRGL